MRPVITNATLTSITGGGSSEDYRAAEGPDEVTRWEGESPCYVRESAITTFAAQGGNLDLQKLTAVIIDASLGRPQIGDNITFTLLGEPQRRKVWQVESHMIGSAPFGYKVFLER